MGLVDPRVKKQAKILVDYSTRVKRGDNVMIVADFGAKPLVIKDLRQGGELWFDDKLVQKDGKWLI